MKNIILKLLPISLMILTSCSREEIAPPATKSEQPMSRIASQQSVTFSAPEGFSCRNILVDASHDGGVWWYPQGPGAFDANLSHQGYELAQLLRSKGFRVDELPRGITVSESVLQNYSMIIRANGFEAYAQEELDAYQKALDRGITLLLLADHTKNDQTDELAAMLDVRFEGAAEGTVSKFVAHPLTHGISYFYYGVGSVLVNVDSNKNIEPIGWLTDGNPVMAVLRHPTSEIFLMGDVNAIEFQPQMFADNLANWNKEKCDLR